MTNEKPKANLAKTLYETLKETEFVCGRCGNLVLAAWDCCAACGHTECQDR